MLLKNHKSATATVCYSEISPRYDAQLKLARDANPAEVQYIIYILIGEIASHVAIGSLLLGYELYVPLGMFCTSVPDKADGLYLFERCGVVCVCLSFLRTVRYIRRRGHRLFAVLLCEPQAKVYNKIQHLQIRPTTPPDRSHSVVLLTATVAI
jgi:hypothetical protein